MSQLTEQYPSIADLITKLARHDSKQLALASRDHEVQTYLATLARDGSLVDRSNELLAFFQQESWTNAEARRFSNHLYLLLTDAGSNPNK